MRKCGFRGSTIVKGIRDIILRDENMNFNRLYFSSMWHFKLELQNGKSKKNHIRSRSYGG